MLRQSDALADDLRNLHDRARGQAGRVAQEWVGVSHVYLTGNGDSYHAALATEMAFQTLAGVRCQALSALRLLEYGAPWDRPPALPNGTAVIGISASGGNERVLQVLERASRHSARTLAITSTAESPLARAAEHALVTPLPGLRPCPGIRTYQASLLALLSIAVELGHRRGLRSVGASDGELLAVAEAIEATVAAVRPRCEGLAARVANAPVMVMLGTGPGYGSARFAAAKVVEAAGQYAAGQDLEEWEHVETLAHPSDMPTIVIAAPGRSRDRAVAVAARARARGRAVVAVADAEDRDMAAHADVVLPLCGVIREEFSPLVSHVFGGVLSYEITRRLGRSPFSTHKMP
ncbi:SIS domain-containing protein [Nonomuraea turkmeniaca]|nr:SIS domain-containing protein [Nonomuraea turkmeniaca]